MVVLNFSMECSFFKCNEITSENATLYWSKDGDTWNKCNTIKGSYSWDLFSDPDGQFLAAIPYVKPYGGALCWNHKKPI